MKILLTGATGFLGSNIARELLLNGYQVYATHRTSSLFSKCAQFKNNIFWINTDNTYWKEQIKDIKPEQFIHAAWEGIETPDRNNWSLQIRNFWYSKELFDLAKECRAKKVIAFGSQAEYGTYSFAMNETTEPKPNDAYGAVKTLTANYLRCEFESSFGEWYWIRIFSVFGDGENSNWLIPTVISKLLRNEQIQLTPCEQHYNYLYIEDFLTQFMKVVQSSENKSGIFNLCNSKSIRLRDLLTQIAHMIGASPQLLKFGAIPYRTGQNMLISGDNTKFKNCFSTNDKTKINMSNGLLKTIEYHKKGQL